MLVLDVNVLIYAHRIDSCEDHTAYADWLTEVATGFGPFALSSLALSGLVRIVTNRGSFDARRRLEEVFPSSTNSSFARMHAPFIPARAI